VTDLPHFSLPFRFTSPRAAVAEQDSLDEISDCVLAVLLCPLGFRDELPPFGIDDPTFSSPRVDLDAIRLAIERWEPRAGTLLAQYPNLLDEFAARLELQINVRTQR